MATSLRIVLVASALIVLLFMMGKIRKSQMKAMDASFWLLFSLSFVVLAAFPQIAAHLAALLGFQAASNFIFVYVIAVLVVRDFSSSVKYSRLRDRFDNLVEEFALSGSFVEDDVSKR